MLKLSKYAFCGAAILLSSLILTGTAWSQATKPAAKPAAAQAKPAVAKPAAATPAPEVVRSVPKIIATVNGEDISYQKLANTCIDDYGADVLERIISRYILEMACEDAKVTITPEEMDAELAAMAARFGIPVTQYLTMIQEERGISPTIFKMDIIWPMLAAKKLVSPASVQATPEEIQREYDSLYGSAVRVRLISMVSKDELEKIRKQVVAEPEKFPEVAQKHSTDTYSASLGGMVPDVRRHQNTPELDAVIFAMKPGDVSELIPVGNQFMIMRCEELVPSDPAITLEHVKDELAKNISQFKVKTAGSQLLQKKAMEAKVEIFLGDAAKSAQRPGVMAIVNGKVISRAVLANECVALHGQRALEGLVNRTLIEQEIKRRKIAITDKDLDKKIADMALEALPSKADGSPDVEQFLKRNLTQLGTTLQRYRSDVVWPTVALEMLVNDKIVITQEDLQKGYTANFGKKVMCRAIVQTDMRRAMQVWGKARENATEEHFIELAKKYSVDAGTGALGGEIPPIQQYGGAPELEKAAFALAEGELSGVIQVENMYVILLCTGFTKPIGVSFDEVKEYILKDLKSKKTEMAISEEFEKLASAATIDNYLVGSTKTPVQPKEAVASN